MLLVECDHRQDVPAPVCKKLVPTVRDSARIERLTRWKILKTRKQKLFWPKIILAD